MIILDFLGVKKYRLHSYTYHHTSTQKKNFMIIPESV